MSANNSISQLLEQFLELNTNSLETFNRINEAITTDKETVALDLFDTNTQTMRTVQIPAFGYLKREIDRLNKNVQQISGVEGSSANVRLKDGSFRKIHTTRLKGPSKPITSLAAPTQFNTKLNEFFEDFLNPLLTVRLDVSGQIPVETERVYIERFIIDNNDPNSIDEFEESYRGQSEVDYDTFSNELINNNIKYYVDSEVIEMPIRTIQYNGNFDVTKISNEQRTQIVDGVSQTKTIKLFTLNKLTYSDSSKNQKETEVLKTNDSLIINSGEYKTRYLIKGIDASTSQVELELLEGYEPINVGAAQLSIYKDVDTDLDIEIKIGFDERQIIFVKPIDSVSNIPANTYSPGIGFYSNDLTLTQVDGTQVSLAKYYKEEVADFGQFIKSLKVDYIPPASVGLVPNAPVLQDDNFKVIQINKHLTDNSTTQKIKRLKSDKIASEQTLKQLDESIRQKKAELNTRKFKSQIEKDKQKNELNSLISERDSESKLYASLVTDIKASAESSDLAKVSPKFRVRGFWSVPEPKIIGEEVSQEVVQFKIRYRYVSTNGKTSQIEQIKFNDGVNNTEKTAAFSNWVEVNGPVRSRGKNDNGVYEWMSESEEDAQAVNFNSLDIPISSGEIVEIMVKSVSEAGFPANPVVSDWSEITRIEFPEGELATDSLSSVVSSNEIDNIKVQIESDLSATGLYQHIGDGFTTNDKFFAHTATGIASGFLTNEQAPISVYDKLVQLQEEILRLRAQVEGTIGELQVRIIDEDGNVTPVTNNSKVKLFAGYYIDELPETNFKGFIVTKNFKVELSNTKATNLELIARIIGDRTQPAYTSTDNTKFGLGTGTIDPKVVDNTYYTTEGKYDLVPVVYQNLDSTDIVDYEWFNSSPEQSSQLRGQFINSRFTNLANDKDFYVIEDIGGGDTGYSLYEYGLNYNIGGVSTLSDGSKDYSGATLDVYDNSGSESTVDFIWNGGYDSSGPLLTTLATVTNTKYNNGILMHVDHPLLQGNGGNLTLLDIQSNGMVGFPKTTPRRSDDSHGKQQTAFKIIETINKEGNPGLRKTIKNSFEPDDQYLLGGHSCGSFLYVAPLDKESLVVDADNKTGKTIIPGGNTNAITLDLVFQYRMTDYYGPGSSGIGRVGGVVTGISTNLTYTKEIGLDILDSYNNSFKFDISVYAKYRPLGKNINSIDASLLTNYNTFASGSSSNTNIRNAFLSKEIDFGLPNIYGDRT
jgi:hypothetical protein